MSMGTARLDRGTHPALPPGFTVDEFTTTVGASIADVSVHVFRTPRRADGSHAFLYEHVRCRRQAVFATGASVTVRLPDGERTFYMSPDLGPCQIDMSADVPYPDRGELIEFATEHLVALKADTLAKRLPRLALRVGDAPETLVDPRSLAVHQEGLFRIGHGWLARWVETADVVAPCIPDAAADLRIYAIDGRCVVLRVDLL